MSLDPTVIPAQSHGVLPPTVIACVHDNRN